MVIYNRINSSIDFQPSGPANAQWFVELLGGALIGPVLTATAAVFDL